jgi:CRP/FNR family transcriptional regulator
VGNADCMHCSLRNSALFHGLTEDDFKQFHKPVDQLTLQSGQVLYKMGDSGSHLFTVRSGLLKLVQSLPGGTQRVVRLLHSTDVLGLEILVSDKYEHEVVALRPTEICRYPVEAVNVLSRSNPVLHKDLMAQWKKALTEADAWLTHLSTGPAKKRMANLLLRLVEGADSVECYIFNREDMGSILSLTTETASRTISELEKSGLMKKLSHNHYQLNIHGLQAAIES